LKSTDGGTQTGAKSATCNSLLTAISLKSGDKSSMSLLKIKEFDPNYRETFQGKDIKGMGVYASPEEKIGTVSDILVDDQGHFRYFVVDLGLWIFGKKVLLPVGRSRIDHSAERIYTVGMTKQQAENLPEFSEHREVDYNYEEQVRGVYRSEAFLENSAPLDTSAARGVGLDAPSSRGAASAVATPPEKPILHNGSAYDYKQEPALYELNEQDHQTFKLYQERLIANKIRAKTGEVIVGKHTETETAKVSVPIDKERVVIERVTPTDAGEAVIPGSVSFGTGEVTRIDVYEETADIHKEAFLREEVRVNKVVDHETIEGEETLRREELDVNTQEHPNVERR
jgi:uncharacterized protein (TIGR02271 family)